MIGQTPRQQTWASNHSSSKGFTLAELLIVVAIIAVLVAIAIPVFSAQLEKSRRAVDMQTARTVQSAIANAYSEGRITIPGDSNQSRDGIGVWVTICRDKDSRPRDYWDSMLKNGTVFCGSNPGVVVDGHQASSNWRDYNNYVEEVLADFGIDASNLSLKSSGGNEGWDWIVIEVGFADGKLQSRMFSGKAGASSSLANNKTGQSNLEKQIG